MTISPVAFPGDDDAGGRDDVAATVAEAVAAAEARFAELESDTFGQGSVIGDPMTMPPVPAYAPVPPGGYAGTGDEPAAGEG